MRVVVLLLFTNNSIKQRKNDDDDALFSSLNLLNSSFFSLKLPTDAMPLNSERDKLTNLQTRDEKKR